MIGSGGDAKGQWQAKGEGSRRVGVHTKGGRPGQGRMHTEEPHVIGRGGDAKGQWQAKGEGSGRVGVHTKGGRPGQGRTEPGQGSAYEQCR